MGVGRRRGHVGTLPGVVRSVRVVAERPDGQVRAGQRVARGRVAAGARGILLVSPPGAFQRGRGGRRGAVGEPGAVGIREAEGRQSGVAPELLRIDAALLEGGVDVGLQQPVGRQVGQHHLEVRPRRQRLTERHDELRQRRQRVGEVHAALGEHAADHPQLLEDAVQVGVVVDDAAHLGRERAHALEQLTHRVVALVDRRQQRLGVDQQLVDLPAAVAQHAGDLVGVGEQFLDLVVAFADRVGEPRDPVQRCAEVRVGLVDGLREHVERLFDGLGVPAGGVAADVEERVVDLIGRGGLAQRQRAAGLQHLGAAGLDLDVAPAQDGVGADGRPALLADLGAAERITDDDLVAVDLHRSHRADIDAGDAHLVSVVQPAGVGELRVVGGRREQHRHAGETLAHPDHEDHDQDAHQPVADAVGPFEDSHFGVHLPVGWLHTLTLRTGPPGCNPLSFNVMSHA